MRDGRDGFRPAGHEVIPDDWHTNPPADEPLMANGWTRSAWRARLRQMADACRALNPARAVELEREAET